MGWHFYKNAWAHIENDEDLSDPQVQETLVRARNEVDQLLERKALISNAGQDFPDLATKTPQQSWDEYLEGDPDSGFYRLDRPGRYEIKIINGQPIIYLAPRRQIRREQKEVPTDAELPLRQPVPCYDLHDNDVFQGFVVCGLAGNRWSDPYYWQPEDPDLSYGSEEVGHVRYPAGHQHRTGFGMLTELKALDIISEKNGRMDDQNRTEDELTYFDTESHWIDVEHGYEQPDYPDATVIPSLWEAAGFGNPEQGFPCSDCNAGETDWGGKDRDSWYTCDWQSGYLFYRHVTNYCACSNACWTKILGEGHCDRQIGSRPWPAHAPAWMHPDYCLFHIYELWKGHAEVECFLQCIMVCNSEWKSGGYHTGCLTSSEPSFCQCLIEKTRYLQKYIYSDILVDGEAVWSTHAFLYKWQKWQVEGCHQCDCAIMWENQTQSGQTLILEDYAIVAPGFEDRGYKSGDHWMALVQELQYVNTYQIEISPPYFGPDNTKEACAWQSDPIVEEYPYRWSIVFDDGTKWVIHDPGTDDDAVWTDTFKIYDFHGKPVYIGGIFVMADFGNAPSKRYYFMYYEGKFYLEKEGGISPDHNCAWFGCYEHDVYGTADGLELLGGEANGYGNGKCRAVGRYDTFWNSQTIPLAERVHEEV